MLLDETKVVSSFLSNNEEKTNVTNLRYLENGASNHLTGFKTKFTELNEEITGHVGCIWMRG